MRQVGERGQVAPLLALLVVIAGAAALVLGRLGGLAVARAQARTAADAAALAGAAAGRQDANELAQANGARVVGYRSEDADTEVRVMVGRVDEVARARREGGLLGFPGGPAPVVGRGGLAPAMVAAVARAEQLLGRPVPIASGYRSRAQQEALYRNRHRNPYPVAAPGRSMHERGLAIDVPRWFVPTLLRVAPAAGLCRPYPTADPVHFESCRRSLGA